MTTASDRPDLLGYEHPLIYKYVGARSVALSEEDGESTLRLRPDLRGPHGPKAAALGVLIQDLSAVTVTRFAPMAVPIQINIRVRTPASSLTEVAAHGYTLRRGRGVMASEARVTDPADRSRVVAFVTASWATAGAVLTEAKPTLQGPGTPEPGDPDPQAASMLDFIGATRRADGRGWELVEGPGAHAEQIALGGAARGLLHAGALQVLLEGAATTTAATQVPEDSLMIEELGTQFLAPARLGPISAIAELLVVSDDSVDCRVELREEGGAGRLSALSFARFRVIH